MSLNTLEWKENLRKVAAQQPKGENLDDDDVESAFSDQAWMQIQNKIRPLTKDPHPLGFEIVWKNDSNSKMIGIYAFRVDKNLIYAPVFFINGEIKGTDLLYQHDKKLFVPASNEWAEFLISDKAHSRGQGVDKSEYDDNAKQMDLENIARIPDVGRYGDFSSKQASEVFQEICKEAEEIVKSASEEKSLLKDFLQTTGKKGFDKLANTITNDYEFANAFLKSIPEENWFLSDEELLQTEKQAAANENNDYLKFHYGFSNPNVPMEKRSNHLKKGYTFEDTRRDTRMNVIYERSNEDLVSISEGGLYEVVLRGGELKKLFAAPVNDNWNPMHTELGTSDVLSDNSKTFLFLDPKTQKIKKESVNRGENAVAYGKKLAEISDYPNDLKFVESPRKNKSYIMYDKVAKECVGPFYIIDRKTYDGVTKLKVSRSCSNDSTPEVLILNAGFNKVDHINNYFDKDLVCFFSVNFNKSDDFVDFGYMDISFGNQEDVTNHVINLTGYKMASVSKPNNNFYKLKIDNYTFPELERVEAIGNLMKVAEVREDVAEEVIAKADGSESKTYDFLCKDAKLSFDSMDPNFFTKYLNEFGVQEADPHQTEIMDANQQDNTHHYNNQTIYDGEFDRDAKNEDRLATATPMELFQMSEETGQRSIFEHGIVGSLVKTHDADDIVTKYLPDLRQGLDKIGRILFLLHWKPEDFQERYGADDLAELENMLVSNFKSFGELVLDLIKKNPNSLSQQVDTD